MVSKQVHVQYICVWSQSSKFLALVSEGKGWAEAELECSCFRDLQVKGSLAWVGGGSLQRGVPPFGPGWSLSAPPPQSSCPFN